MCIRDRVTGTRDYVHKNRFGSVVLGLSGGIDSALVATIAGDALGPAAVHVIGLPSRHSSEGSVADAEELARRQGLHLSLIHISEPTRLGMISYAVFCLKKKKKNKQNKKTK